MLPSPLATRIILATTLLLSLLAAAGQPAQAQRAQEQLRPQSTMAVDATPRRARLEGKWSIKVRGWAKPFKRGDQARIDHCRATLWWGSLPSANQQRPTWLAGHNSCGFWRWDKWLPVGARFTIKSPLGKVRKFEVYARGFINRKSGSSDGLIHGDVTLQTCRGNGMTFVYARLVD